MESRFLTAAPYALATLLIGVCTLARADEITLPGHMPTRAMARSTRLGRKLSTDRMRLAVTVKSGKEADLDDFVTRLHDPSDPQYHQFISSTEFVARFAPSNEQAQEVVSYLQNMGLTVVEIHPNHLIVDVEGTEQQIEDAFKVEVDDYLSRDGRVVHAPLTDPVVGSEMSGRIGSIVGLSSFSFRKSHLANSKVKLAEGVQGSRASVTDYMTPSKIQSAYNLSSIAATGTGESLALFELDGYKSTDITYYTNYFSLTTPTLSNVLVDSAAGTAGSSTEEVALDIELAIAVAPGLNKIIVYEGPNTSAGVIDTYNRIATDNLAGTVSSSWGASENEVTSSELNSENTIFQQMASQNMSVFAAAGDSGAYDDSPNGDNTNFRVDDPGSQPHVTSVGGTKITLSGTSYGSETSWVASTSTGTYGQSSYVEAEGGGGGISAIWTQPTWQSGLNSTANLGSSSSRMVPDVALEADPTMGYPVYVTMPNTAAGWYLVGGTSCAAPMWAAFVARVNQQRITNGSARLGEFNPVLYPIAKNSVGGAYFHDIADGSTNLHYPATTGYDLTTGWGSFNGANLFPCLVTGVCPPSAPQNVTATPGTLSISLAWTANSSATSYTIYRSTTSGSGYTGVGTSTTNSYQDTGLTYGTTYYYEITTTNSAGTSSMSTAVSATPNPSVPGAPSNLTAVLNP